MSDKNKSQLHELERPEEGQPKTIDITPTWTTAVRIHLEVIKNMRNTGKALRESEEEILKAAAFVDNFNANIAPRLREIVSLADPDNNDDDSYERLRQVNTAITRIIKSL